MSALSLIPQEGFKMADQPFPITMEEVTDPEELVKARVQRERFDRNFAWFRTHAAEIFARARG